jgi:hypothetical protein
MLYVLSGVYSRYSRCWLLRTYFDVMPVPIFDAEKDSLLTHLEVKTTAGPAPKGSHLSQPEHGAMRVIPTCACAHRRRL